MKFPPMAALLAAVLVAAPAQAEKRIRLSDFTTPRPAPAGSIIVIGFLGGWEPWDNPKRSARKLALRLRTMNLAGLYVETAGNHSRETVLTFLRQALDANGDGKLQAEEAAAARLVLYGQSFGGAAVVKLARELARWNVPVALTVLVDSVGRNDALIPPNVKRAMNFYQRDPGPIRGENRIRAADPARTGILGNQRFTYRLRHDIDLSDYPRLGRVAPIAHWKMDNDPAVWDLVEELILAEHERVAAPAPPLSSPGPAKTGGLPRWR